MNTKNDIAHHLLSKIKFNDKNLISAITIDQSTREVLMLAYMNKEALLKTLETKMMYYWSRSRKELWFKGGTSKNTQKVHRIRIDCDGDALIFEVTPQGVGAACHDGYYSCFYKEWKNTQWETIKNESPLFDPKTVY